MQSLMRTIEQERAKYAWNCVQTCVEQAINALNQKIAQERDEKKKESCKNDCKVFNLMRVGKSGRKNMVRYLAEFHLLF